MLIAIGILIFVIILIFAVPDATKKQEASKKKLYSDLEGSGFDIKVITEASRYMGGHPKIDNSQPNVQLIAKSDKTIAVVHLSISGNDWFFKPLGFIPQSKIKDIAIEDATSIEKRVTAGRVLLLGVFALAAKKKEKKEKAYMVISWNDGRFDHDTVFEFEGTGAFENANKSRNILINNLSADN